MTFSGIRIIKSFVCEEKYKRFFQKALDTRFITELNLIKLGTALHLTFEYIHNFALISIILSGGYMVVADKITIGTFFAFYTYLMMIVFPILDLPTLFTSAKQAFVCIDRLEEIKEHPVKSYQNSECGIRNAELKDESVYLRIPNSEFRILNSIDSIKFVNVSFTYDERNTKTLDNISFEIKKGEKILILGRSGTGKTTILGLLSGLLIPQEGEIYINDIPIRNIDQTRLRELIGYVPQEPSLFSGTIEYNVLFGAPPLSEGGLRGEFAVEGESAISPPRLEGVGGGSHYDSIISAVQMKEEINQFTEKDQTKVGQKGLTLSGGQKQRLAIARALYKKPELLILDDITASLDAKKEELLWEQISQIFKNLTAFIVSHRLSSLRYADKIMLIDEGQIKATGKHEELITSHEPYQDFIQHHYK
jgi:ABC-type multidrug transport system fused ATPase/permease subunit